MTARLDGQVILVTGSTAGLGRNMVERFAAAGANVVVTGRNARDELIEIADLVTEMTEIKHPFRAGVKAQAGIEF